jgi:hypothetical protein
MPFALLSARNAACVLPLCALVACSDGGRDSATQKTTPDASSSPIADAYAALVRGDYQALPGITAALDDAVAQNPADQLSAFYAGVMHLWRITQRKDDPSYTNTDFGSDLQKAFAELDSARKLNPRDAHAAAFYGIAKVDEGNLASSQQLIDEGRQVLEAAVPLYPAYVHGVQALAFGALPKAHPDFPRAAEALRGTVSACAPGVDGGNHSFAYTTAQPADRVGACTDEGVVAHVWEGFWLTYGDIAAKQGDADGARVAYENVKNAPRYDRWVLSDVLDQRLRDLDSRIQLYGDADPKNDPTTWMDEGHLCIGCHANRP